MASASAQGFPTGMSQPLGSGGSPLSVHQPHPHDTSSSSSRSKKRKQQHHQQGGPPQNASHSVPPHLRRPPPPSSQQGPLPPPNMGPPLSVGPMGWGTAYDDESTDFVMDEMDRLTPRDLAVARFRKNHELMEGIFDERRIADLQPNPSPYANLSATELKEQLKIALKSTQDMEKFHAERVKLFKRGDDQQNTPQPNDDDDDDVPAWARQAGQGKLLTAGYPYARAPTPDFLRKQVDEQKRAEEAEQREIERRQAEDREHIRAAQEAQAQAQAQAQAAQAQLPSEDIKMQDVEVDGDGDGDSQNEDDADADADEDADGDADADDDHDQEQVEVKREASVAATNEEQSSLSTLGGAESERRTQEIEAITKVNQRMGIEREPAGSVVGNQIEAAAQQGTSASVADAGTESKDSDTVEIIQKDVSEKVSAQNEATSVQEPATLGTESANITHPLSAEAEAAFNEPKGEGAIEAGIAQVEQAAQQGTAAGAAAPIDGKTDPGTSEGAGQQVAVEMKAPTPTLDENVGEIDAPRQL